MENILNILYEELIIPMDEEIVNILNDGNNNGDEIEEVLDELLLGILLVADDNGIDIRPRRGAPIRIRNYFEETIPQMFDDQFYENFRMRRETFIELENIIRPHVHDSRIPLAKKILMTIWLLATPESFRSVAERFDFPKTVAHFAFKEIVEALVTLLHEYVRWPNPEECNNIEAAFNSRQERFSGIIGAIDGCHIKIKQPPGNTNDYYNRKGFHSIILQGTCDHNGRFIDVFIGRPGRAHDASVFRSSPLFRSLHNEDNPLLRPEKHILGDSAYPLSLNVLTPFRDNGHLSEQQTLYNTKHASLRSVIERAFGLLKAKFRRLDNVDARSVGMANKIIAASCTLHNFILMHGNANVWDHNINVENNDDDDDDNDDEDEELEEDENEIEDMAATEKRRQIMNAIFH